jgi:hypothetical protein
MSKFPSKKKKYLGEDGVELAAIPDSIQRLECSYRGKVHRVPYWLHPKHSCFDDAAFDADEFLLFVHTGKIPRKRLEFEQKYQP